MAALPGAPAAGLAAAPPALPAALPTRLAFLLLLTLPVLLAFLLSPVTSAGARELATAGSYVGDGAGLRVVDGTGFRPVAVIVHQDDANPAGDLTAAPAPSVARPCPRTDCLRVGRIVGFMDDGFVLGPEPAANTAGTTYRWVALREEPAVVACYVGDGSAAREITGLGFRPAAVLILPREPGACLPRTAALPPETILPLAPPGPAGSQGIAELTADGFRLGAGDEFNEHGRNYCYVAWSDTGIVRPARLDGPPPVGAACPSRTAGAVCYLSLIGECRPTDPEAKARHAELNRLYRRALAAVDAGRRDEAVGCWERAWSLDPAHADVVEHLKREYLVRGMSAFSANDVDGAVRDWQRALAVDPEDARARGYLTRACEQRSRIHKIRSESP
ncbi:MAG: tetratricopeptide repeat protein [Candidatus Krumholzibacteriia bacterium]